MNQQEARAMRISGCGRTLNLIHWTSCGLWKPSTPTPASTFPSVTTLGLPPSRDLSLTLPPTPKYPRAWQVRGYLGACR
jgi:hypothetical protein